MELSDLTAYAAEKYRIQEQHKWTEFPGFSVLCHPQTGKWVALLMRQRDADSGKEIQRCDLKCGSGEQFGRPYLTAPFRMHGENWLGVCFDVRTEPQIVFELLDRAIAMENPHGAAIVLEAKDSPRGTDYQETPLPFSDSSSQPARERPPEKLRRMRHMFEYDREDMEIQAKNFYRQAVFMEDFEDDSRWPGGEFARPMPTYQDLTTKQLRGYFSWRTEVRRGHFTPIPASVATIYVFELLNGVGADSPEDVLEKLQAFIKGFADSDMSDDPTLRKQVYRWMLEYGVLWDVPPETLREYVDPDMIALDAAMAVLKEPEAHSAEEIFSALCQVGGEKIANSPVIQLNPARGRKLFSHAWQSFDRTNNEQKLFERFISKEKIRFPCPMLETAVYVDIEQPKDREYVLDECRSFTYSNGLWWMHAYSISSSARSLLKQFLHETDARLRRYLKAGRMLRENPKEAWAIPFIDEAIERDREAVRQAEMEAQRQKVTIDFSGLEQIRKDAGMTRDSLLTEEERDEPDEPVPQHSVEAAVPALLHSEEMTAPALLHSEEMTAPTLMHSEEWACRHSGSLSDMSTEKQRCPKTESLPIKKEAAPAALLDDLQREVIRGLLRGEEVTGLLRSAHRLPSMTADAINEALFEEIGDTVILCENDRLSLVEDYIGDLERILGVGPSRSDS